MHLRAKMVCGVNIVQQVCEYNNVMYQINNYNNVMTNDIISLNIATCQFIEYKCTKSD